MKEKDEKVEKLKLNFEKELEKFKEDLRMKNEEEVETARQKYEREKELVSLLLKYFATISPCANNMNCLCYACFWGAFSVHQICYYYFINVARKSGAFPLFRAIVKFSSTNRLFTLLMVIIHFIFHHPFL